jgi:hypothetical protein
MIKLVLWLNCTTGFSLNTPAHSWTVQNTFSYYRWSDLFFFYPYIWVRWWWGPSTQTKDSIRLTLSEVPAPFRQLSSIKISANYTHDELKIRPIGHITLFHGQNKCDQQIVLLSLFFFFLLLYNHILISSMNRFTMCMCILGN